LPDNLEGLLDASALGDNILDDQHAFTRSDLESTPEDQIPLLLLREDEPASELPGDFLSDHQAPHRGRDHRLDLKTRDPLGNRRPELFNDRHLLKGQGALEELAGVQSAAKDKMPFEECTGLTEEIQGFSVCHAARLKRET
jgi:hypothetical protein